MYSNIFSQFQILSYFIEWKVLDEKGSRRIMLHFLMSQETLFMVTCQIVYEQTHFLDIDKFFSSRDILYKNTSDVLLDVTDFNKSY